MRRGVRQAMVGSVAVLMWLGGAGCVAPGGRAQRAGSPGGIEHVVFFSLADPDDAPELIRDCDEWIAPIPGVISYACGPAYDSGRAGVERDYDVGIVVGFASAADYESYIEHPDHVRMQERWRGRMRRVEIRDVLDETR